MTIVSRLKSKRRSFALLIRQCLHCYLKSKNCLAKKPAKQLRINFFIIKISFRYLISGYKAYHTGWRCKTSDSLNYKEYVTMIIIINVKFETVFCVVQQTNRPRIKTFWLQTSCNKFSSNLSVSPPTTFHL